MEEQLKRNQSRKIDSEFRLQKLRQARGLSTPSDSTASQPEGKVEFNSSSPSSSSVELKSDEKNDSKHINLFEGIRIFYPITDVKDEEKEEINNKKKKMRKEEVPRVVTVEDEKYGVAGKGVKLPWYMAKLQRGDAGEKNNSDDDNSVGELEIGGRNGGRHGGSNEAKKKKPLQELRKERLKRERKEKKSQ